MEFLEQCLVGELSIGARAVLAWLFFSSGYALAGMLLKQHSDRGLLDVTLDHVDRLPFRIGKVLRFPVTFLYGLAVLSLFFLVMCPVVLGGMLSLVLLVVWVMGKLGLVAP